MKDKHIKLFHYIATIHIFKPAIRLSVILGFIILISLIACTAPQPLPEGPTPIPTLIPATMPSSTVKSSDTTTLVIESYPAGLPSASTGQDLYDEHCAECHGFDGNGLVPNARNFGDVDYMRGETPGEFYVIITEGRGTEMPAFGEALSSDERWAIVYYVWRFSTTDEILQRGSEIYTTNCASCHGEDGRSMILGAANFPDQRFLSNQSPSDLYVSVTQGQGSMPAWQARLSIDDRWAVIDYIRTFTYDPHVGQEEEVPIPETEPAGDEADRSECTPYRELSNPFNWEDAEAIASGALLYNSCISCHGEDGTGRLPGILDFSAPATRADLRNNPGRYICSIAEGFQSMPAFKSMLNEEEMWKILIYIATFGD